MDHGPQVLYNTKGRVPAAGRRFCMPFSYPRTVRLVGDSLIPLPTPDTVRGGDGFVVLSSIDEGDFVKPIFSLGTAKIG